MHITKGVQKIILGFSLRNQIKRQTKENLHVNKQLFVKFLYSRQTK